MPVGESETALEHSASRGYLASLSASFVISHYTLTRFYIFRAPLTIGA
jgi:hypothetical protein